jgi:hypothetical protein
MNRSTALAASIAGFAFACPASSIAQTAKDIAGTYRTASNVNVSADGKRTDTFGPNGTGMAIFTADGRFTVVNVNPDTPKFASNGVLVMNVEASTYPNWTGTRQTRTLTDYSADHIKWTLPGSVGGTSEVIYRRMK